jgi:hypothetical protein
MLLVPVHPLREIVRFEKMPFTHSIIKTFY